MGKTPVLLSAILLTALAFSACIPTYRAPSKLANLPPSSGTFLPSLDDPGDLAIDANNIIHVVRPQCNSASNACSLVYEQYLLGSRLLQRVIPPPQGSSVVNPQVVVDPTGDVHVAWEECPTPSLQYCRIYYRRMVPDAPAIPVTVGIALTKAKMMRLVTNGDLPEEATITLPAVYVTFGGLGSNSQLYNQICTISLSTIPDSICKEVGNPISSFSTVMTSSTAAVAADGTLAAAMAWERTTTTYDMFMTLPLDLPGSNLGTYQFTPPRQIQHLRVAFSYHRSPWSLYLMYTSVEAPSYAETGLIRCGQNATGLCTQDYNKLISTSFVQPNPVQGVDLAVTPYGVPTIVHTAQGPIGGTRTTNIFVASCPNDGTLCHLEPLEHPRAQGFGDENPRLFVLDGYIGTAWQRSDGPSQVADLQVHHIGAGVLSLPRPSGSYATGYNYALDVDRSNIAGLWVANDPQGVRHSWLVYNANQTSLPIALK